MTTAALQPAVPSEISQMCEHGCPSPFEIAAPKIFQAWVLSSRLWGRSGTVSSGLPS